MRRKMIFVGTAAVLLLLCATLVLVTRRRASAGAAAAKAQITTTFAEDFISAPGRVEPVSEEVEVGAEISGKIREVRVEEGDAVTRGQVLAVLVNDDYAAQVRTAEAQIRDADAQREAAAARLLTAQAEQRRIINGARSEERREARAAEAQGEATLRNARVEAERRQQLYRDGDISREELDRALRDAEVARARLDELRERANFVSAAAREEDLARADAAIKLARAQIGEAAARGEEARARAEQMRAALAKTFVRAPLSGVVLRKRLKAGESYSLETPDVSKASLFTVADTSVLRVRVDVDEVDVGKLKLGQAAYVTADAYGARRFGGRVIRIGQVLGQKNVRTEEPTERVDTKILETLIELDEGARLPPGLRVDAFIVSDASTAQIVPAGGAPALR